MAERIAAQEDPKLWKHSRLFKTGLIVAFGGAVLGLHEVAVVGLIAMGGAWALWRGKKK